MIPETTNYMAYIFIGIIVFGISIPYYLSYLIPKEKEEGKIACPNCGKLSHNPIYFRCQGCQVISCSSCHVFVDGKTTCLDCLKKQVAKQKING